MDCTVIASLYCPFTSLLCTVIAFIPYLSMPFLTVFPCCHCASVLPFFTVITRFASSALSFHSLTFPLLYLSVLRLCLLVVACIASGTVLYASALSFHSASVLPLLSLLSFLLFTVIALLLYLSVLTVISASVSSLCSSSGVWYCHCPNCPSIYPSASLLLFHSARFDSLPSASLLRLASSRASASSSDRQAYPQKVNHSHSAAVARFFNRRTRFCSVLRYCALLALPCLRHGKRRTECDCCCAILRFASL